MKVEKIEKQDFEQWNEFLIQSPQYNLFANSWYLEALGIRFEILVVKDNSTIKGGFILAKDKWNYYINPVFCKYLGVYFYDFKGNNYTIESRRRKVQQLLIEEIIKLPSFEYTFHPNFNNWILFQRAGFKQSTVYTYFISLKNSESVLLDNMNARLRNKILNANKLKYSIREIADMSLAIPIIERTYLDKGSSLPIKKKSILELCESLKTHNGFQLFGVFGNEIEPIAVLGLFYDQLTAYLIFNAIDSNNQDKGVNEWLIFEGMKWAKNKGLIQFDFEGSMIPSIESFYRQFGGELTPYHKIWMESKQRTLRNIKKKIL